MVNNALAASNGLVCRLAPDRSIVIEKNSHAKDTSTVTLHLPPHASPERIALSRDGQLLAAAGKKALSVYFLYCDDYGLLKGALRWRGHMYAVPKSIDVLNTSNDVRPGARCLSAVGSSMGVEIFDCIATAQEGDFTSLNLKAEFPFERSNLAPQRRGGRDAYRVLLLAGCAVSCVRFAVDSASLVAACLDNTLYYIRVGTVQDRRLDAFIMWRAQIPASVERPTSIDFSPDCSMTALAGWSGAVAVYNCCTFKGGDVIYDDANKSDAEERTKYENQDWRLQHLWNNCNMHSYKTSGELSQSSCPSPVFLAWCRAAHSKGKLIVACSGRPKWKSTEDAGTFKLLCTARGVCNCVDLPVQVSQIEVGEIRGFGTSQMWTNSTKYEGIYWLDSHGIVLKQMLWEYDRPALFARNVSLLGSLYTNPILRFPLFLAYQASDFIDAVRLDEKQTMQEETLPWRRIRDAIKLWIDQKSRLDEPVIVIGKENIALAASGILQVFQRHPKVSYIEKEIDAAPASPAPLCALLRNTPAAAVFLRRSREEGEVLALLITHGTRICLMIESSLNSRTLKVPVHSNDMTVKASTMLGINGDPENFMLVQSLESRLENWDSEQNGGCNMCHYRILRGGIRYSDEGLHLEWAEGQVTTSRRGVIISAPWNDFASAPMPVASDGDCLYFAPSRSGMRGGGNLIRCEISRGSFTTTVADHL